MNCFLQPGKRRRTSLLTERINKNHCWSSTGWMGFYDWNIPRVLNILKENTYHRSLGRDWELLKLIEWASVLFPAADQSNILWLMPSGKEPESIMRYPFICLDTRWLPWTLGEHSLSRIWSPWVGYVHVDPGVFVFLDDLESMIEWWLQCYCIRRMLMSYIYVVHSRPIESQLVLNWLVAVSKRGNEVAQPFRDLIGNPALRCDLTELDGKMHFEALRSTWILYYYPVLSNSDIRILKLHTLILRTGHSWKPNWCHPEVTGIGCGPVSG